MKRILNKTSGGGGVHVTPWRGESANRGEQEYSYDRTSQDHRQGTHAAEHDIRPTSFQHNQFQEEPSSMWHYSQPARNSARQGASSNPYPSYGESHQEPQEHVNPFVAAVLGNSNRSVNRDHNQKQTTHSYNDLPPSQEPRSVAPKSDEGNSPHMASLNTDYVQKHQYEQPRTSSSYRDHRRQNSFPNPFSNNDTSSAPTPATVTNYGRSQSQNHQHDHHRRRPSKGDTDGLSGLTRFRSLRRKGSQSKASQGAVGDDSQHQFLQQQHARENLQSRHQSLPPAQHSIMAEAPEGNAGIDYRGRHRKESYRSRQANEREEPIERSEGRYVDKVTEAPMAVQRDAGMEKVKKKLFSGFGSRKREQEKDEDLVSNGIVAPPSNGSHSSVRNAALAHYPSSEGPIHSVHQGEPKKEGWFAKKEKAPKNSENITSTMGWLCANEASTWDWSYLLSLCDSISHSEAASKEAARALRKEFKYGEEKPRKRAIKVWAVLCLHASDRFMMQIAQKRFLEVCEELVLSNKTPYAVKEMMTDVWSMLAHHFRSDAELQSITKSYNKVRPEGSPLDGRPLDPDHPAFTSPTAPPQAISRNADVRYFLAPQPSQGHSPALSLSAPGTPYELPSNHLDSQNATPAGERMTNHYGTSMADEDAQRLHDECAIARSNSQVLVESLAEHGLDSGLVTEFSAKTQLSQEFLLAQIPWATARADHSRNAIHEERKRAMAEGRQHVSVDKTPGERLLEDLLDAHEKLSVANNMVDEARQERQEEEEERRVIDRSMKDQKMDRSHLWQDPNTGHFYTREQGQLLVAPQGDHAHASGSRSNSPAPTRGPLPDPSLVTRTSAEMAASSYNHVREHSTGSHASDHHSTARSTRSGPGFRGGPRPLLSADDLQKPSVTNGQAPLSIRTNSYPAGENAFDATTSGTRLVRVTSPSHDDAESAIFTPVQPSEKALGKRRAMSVDEENLPAHSHFDNMLASQAQAMQLSNSNASHSTNRSKEEALRARPPPSIPGQNA